MHGIPFDTRLSDLVIRPLRNAGVETVGRVLAELLPGSLGHVDSTQRVLVAYVDEEPVGLGQLVLDPDPTVALMTVAVADRWRRAGIGGELMRLLALDAAAAGVRRVRTMMRLEDTSSIALARRLTRIVSFRIEAGELHLVSIV